MADPIDITGHTVSAGGGAMLGLLIDRFIRFFTERDRREEERRNAERLASIEAQLAGIQAQLKAMQGRDEIMRELGRLEGLINAMERAR